MLYATFKTQDDILEIWWDVVGDQHIKITVIRILF